MAVQDLPPAQLQATLQAMSQRQEKAFRLFYLHYQPLVFAFVRRIVQDDGHAQEVVNDVLMHVCESPQAFEGRSKFSTWLLGIAHHKAVDRVRSLVSQPGRAAVPLDEPEALGVADATPWADVLTQADQAQTLRRLQSCMDKLPQPMAVLAGMAMLEDWTETELAEQLQCPVGTVKSRLYAVRKALKQCLATWYAEVKRV